MITPQTEEKALAQALGIPRLFLKREDLHPYGSHKGRSIPVMIDMKSAEGIKDFAISSSGNAALAALRHIQKRNLEGARLSLVIFIGNNINEKKKTSLVHELTDSKIKIETSERPLQSLMNLIKGKKIASLRQSTDDEALIGYESLAREIAEISNIEAIFIGTSSGTTAQALGKNLPIHIVQTSSVFPIAEALGKTALIKEESTADAIVDRVAHRKNVLSKMLNIQAWIATNEDIKKAQSLLKEKTGIDATPNGALGLAGLIHAQQNGARFTGSVVCIITGK